ncbi:MAG TPA: trigger factor [Candidatus Saccharimonadales bacterium]|nr:trigger factor [Candidatus Saccharimonadales bacterium]
MQVTKKNLSDTKVQLVLTADADQLKKVKKQVLEHLAKETRLPGFRQGKAPLAMVEKHVNPATLQTEFLDEAMNLLYVTALQENNLRPVSQPQVKIQKFVPFETLEVEIEVEVVGEIKLPDYKKIKLAKKEAKVTAKDVTDVIDQLKKREANKKDVDRAAKDGDQVMIDFKGVDAKTKEAINGADGKDYPLLLGSNTFIPGFEANLADMKAGEEKAFTLTFPKDYGVKTLQNRKVEFTVTVKKVQEVIEPKIDDEFAAKVGPFKNVDELKADIKKQLQTEKDYQNDREYTDELLTKITNDAKVAIPDALVDEQLERLLGDHRQNAVYRGTTWQEFLEGEGKTEEEYAKTIRPDAELRVKAGLVLGEIADQEGIVVTPEELEVRMQILKAQYPDEKMQAELDKPEARREIASRMVSEKTVDKLVGYATAK